jgi:hypothetical protein
VRRNKLFSFQLPEDTFHDPDANDTLGLSATLANGRSLPEWLTFDASTREFSGLPTHSDVGTLSIRVTATDRAGASVSDEFDLVVAQSDCAWHGGFRWRLGGGRPNMRDAIAWAWDRRECFGGALDEKEIGAQWHVVRQFSGALLHDFEDSGVWGASSRIDGQNWMDDGGMEGGFGYYASTGELRRTGSFTVFHGLKEGFLQL